MRFKKKKEETHSKRADLGFPEAADKVKDNGS